MRWAWIAVLLAVLVSAPVAAELPFRPAPDEGGAEGLFDPPRDGGNTRFGRRDFAVPMPEPGAALLFAAGATAVAARLRRRR